MQNNWKASNVLKTKDTKAQNRSTAATMKMQKLFP